MIPSESAAEPAAGSVSTTVALEALGQPRASRRLRRILLAIAALAAVHALAVSPDGPRPAFYDERRFRLYVDNLVDEGFFGDRAAQWPAQAELRSVDYSAYLPPGYVAFLAALRPFGRSEAPVRIAQALLVGVATLAATGIAFRMFGPAGAVLAGLAIIASGVMAGYGQFTLSEVLAATTLVGAIWLALVAQARRSVRLFVLAGAILGLSALVRPQVLLLPIPFALWAWLATGRRRAGTIAALALVAGSVAVVMPWTVRNAVRLHALVPVTTYTWINFWLVNNPKADGIFHLPESFVGAEEVRRIRSLPELEQDAAWRRMALGWVRRHPGDAVRGWLRNGRLYITDPDPLIDRWYRVGGARVPRLDDRVLLVVAMLGAALGLAFGPRRLEVLLPALALAYFLAFFMLFLPTPRFRAGMAPVVAVLAPGGFVVAWRTARGALARARGDA